MRSLIAVLAFAVAACKPAAPQAGARADPALVSQLAQARTEAAQARLDQGQPERAFELLVSALETDPSCEAARALVESLLAETVWSLPVLEIPHTLPVEQVAFSAPSTLWVSLGGDARTTVRWDLETLRVGAVMFPAKEGMTRGLVFDATRRSVVVGRGPVNLLCDASTLKPIRDLGPLPDAATPEAVIAFSPDGLLVAHPSVAEGKTIWHLRDRATGETVRSAEAVAPPLAAALDRSRLRVLHADGSLWEMPVSPVEPTRTTPLPEPVKLLHAQFSSDGESVLTLQDQGPHRRPVQSIISYADAEDGSLEPEALMHRFSWSRGPNLWSALMAGPGDAPFVIEGQVVRLAGHPHAPVTTASPVSAAAFQEGILVTGEESGVVTIHRLLPRPGKASVPAKPGKIDPTALKNLCDALTSRLPPGDRAKAFTACDFSAVSAMFPALDFAPLAAAFKSAAFRRTEPEALQPLRERLARALPGEPPAAVKEYALALESDIHERIQACLEAATDMPPLLRRIGVSRIAWLQGNKEDALAVWPEVFPTISEVRLREDWDGWEQADFQPALDRIRQNVRELLTSLEVPSDSTPAQRAEVATRLADPTTVAAVGQRRFAEACLKAALAFSAFKEETETTFRLAATARELGAAPEPCLRAEALALTALGDFQKAQPRWIELITEHPVATHLPGDYAEAAYTSFENADPRQAMQILATGMHRFPQDGNFALRAGWVALLTGDAERAYRFLREGKRIGFPPEKLENATALLAIAAERTGAIDDAAVYFEDLLRIDPAWADVRTLDTLDWPEELKATLAGFAR